MDILSNALITILRKPKIFLYSAAGVLLYCLVEYNVIFPIFMGISKMGMGNFIDYLQYFFRIILEGFSALENNRNWITVIALVLVLGGGIISVFVSGYFNIINSFLDGEDATFWCGVKKYFVRIYRIFISIFIFSLIFFLFCSIVAIPAIVLSRLSISRENLMTLSTILSFVTIVVITFQVLVFRLYSLFWIASGFNYDRSIFKVGKIIADRSFWEVFLRIFIVDLVFIVIQAMMINLNNMYMLQEQNTWVGSGLLFVLNWLFKSVFFTIFVTYILVVFKMYTKKLD